MKEEKTEYTTCSKCGAKLPKPSPYSWRRCFDCQNAARREEFKEATRWDPDRTVQLLPCTGLVAFQKVWSHPKTPTREEYFAESPTPVLAWGLTAGGDIQPFGLIDWPSYLAELEDSLLIHESEIEKVKDEIWGWASGKKEPE